MTLHQTNTGYKPNVSINTGNSGMDTRVARFAPLVDLTHDEEDTNILTCPIFCLQLPTSARFPSNNSALVTFSQAGRRTPCQMLAVSDRTKSDQSESLALTVSRCTPSKSTCSSWTSRSGSICYTTSTRSSE